MTKLLLAALLIPCVATAAPPESIGTRYQTMKLMRARGNLAAADALTEQILQRAQNQPPNGGSADAKIVAELLTARLQRTLARRPLNAPEEIRVTLRTVQDIHQRIQALNTPVWLGAARLVTADGFLDLTDPPPRPEVLQMRLEDTLVTTAERLVHQTCRIPMTVEQSANAATWAAARQVAQSCARWEVTAPELILDDLKQSLVHARLAQARGRLKEAYALWRRIRNLSEDMGLAPHTPQSHFYVEARYHLLFAPLMPTHQMAHWQSAVDAISDLGTPQWAAIARSAQARQMERFSRTNPASRPQAQALRQAACQALKRVRVNPAEAHPTVWSALRADLRWCNTLE